MFPLFSLLFSHRRRRIQQSRLFRPWNGHRVLHPEIMRSMQFRLETMLMLRGLLFRIFNKKDLILYEMSSKRPLATRVTEIDWRNFAELLLIQRRTLTADNFEDFLATFNGKALANTQVLQITLNEPLLSTDKRQRTAARRFFDSADKRFEPIETLAKSAIVLNSQSTAVQQGESFAGRFIEYIKRENITHSIENREHELHRLYKTHDALRATHAHLQQACPMAMVVGSPLVRLFYNVGVDLSALATESDVIACFGDSQLDLRPALNTDSEYFLNVGELIGENAFKCPLFFEFVLRTCRRFHNQQLSKRHNTLFVDLLECINSPQIDLTRVDKFGQKIFGQFLLAQRQNEPREQWLMRKLAYISRCRQLNKEETRVEYAIFILLPFVLDVCSSIITETLNGGPYVTVSGPLEGKFYEFCVANANRNWMLQRFDATTKKNSATTDEECAIFKAITTFDDTLIDSELRSIQDIDHCTSMYFESMASAIPNFLSYDTSQLFQWIVEPSLSGIVRIQLRDVHRLMQLIAEATERLDLLETMVVPHPTRFPLYNCVQFIAHLELFIQATGDSNLIAARRTSSENYVAELIRRAPTPVDLFAVLQGSPPPLFDLDTFRETSRHPTDFLPVLESKPQSPEQSQWDRDFNIFNVENSRQPTSSEETLRRPFDFDDSSPSPFPFLYSSSSSQQFNLEPNSSNQTQHDFRASQQNFSNDDDEFFSRGAASSEPIVPDQDRWNAESMFDSTNSRHFIDSEEEDLLHLLDSDTDVHDDILSSIQVKARISGKRSGRHFVVRRVSAFDRRSQRNLVDDPELIYIAVYQDTVLGEQLGFLSCTRNGGDIKDIEYTDDDVRFALLTYSKNESSTIVGRTIDVDSRATLNNRRGVYRVKIPLTVVYKSHLAETGETNERPYCVFAYLSQGVQTSEPQFFKSIKDAQQEFLLDAESRFNSLPAHTNINFDSYSKYTNEDGIVCLNQAGFASVRLSLLATRKEVTLPLVVPTSVDKIVKAELVVKLHSVSLSFANTDSPDEETLKQEFAATAASIRAYINTNRKFYKKHQAAHANLNNITVFNYKCRNGVVPGCLFDMFRLPLSHDEYFLNVVRIAMQRFLPSLDVTSENMEKIWIGMDRDTQLRASMSAVTIFSGTSDYSNDAIDNNVMGKRWRKDQVEPIDSFDSPRMQQSGDCEDFEEENLAHIMEIKYNHKDFHSRVLSDIHKLFRNFIFFSTLCGVSRGSMGRSGDDEESGYLTAHECGIAIPNWIFFKALRRSDPKHPILSAYTREEQELGRNDHIYILEGTGNLIPDACTVDSQRKSTTSAVKNFSSLSKSNIREQYFYTTDREDKFYKMFINLMTPEFFIRNGQTYFEFLLVDGPDQKRGVLFTDLLRVDSHPEIKIISAPVIPPEILSRSMRIMDDNLPRISLTPIRSDAITDSIRVVAQRLTTTNNEQRSRGGISFEHCVNIQCRFELMTEEKISALLRDAKNNGLNILCTIEAITHNYISGQLFGCYSLFFY